MSDYNWVYVFMIAVELGAILKFTLIWNRFVDHTLLKTLLLISKSFGRMVIFILVIISSAELNWVDRDTLTKTIRLVWLGVGLVMLSFHVFDFYTIVRFEKTKPKKTAIWSRLVD